MALVSNLKEFMTNTIKVNKSRLGSSNADNILSQMDGVTFIGDMVQAGAQANWLFQYTPSYFDNKTIIRVLFNWYNRTDYLNSFLAENVFEGYPTNNNIISKNSFSDTDNILIYMGTTEADGDFKTENEIFSFYYKRETDNTFTRTAGGLRYKKMHYLRDFWIGSPVPVYSPSNFKTRPLFNGYFTGNNINETFNNVINFIASDVNLYQGMNTDNIEAIPEVNYYIVDDNDPTTYHMFRVYNKKQLFNLFLLFDMDLYYKTVEDLQEGINQFDFNDIETTPEQTEPGQPENVIDNLGGAGNFESDVINYPLNAFVGTGTGISTYLLTPKQMQYVLNKVWDPDIISVLTNFDLSPIVNALIWPCNMYTGRVIDGSPAETQTIGVYIGKSPIAFNTLEQQIAYYINPLYIKILDFGILNLKSSDFYKSFLDYEPYTTFNLFLPYYGIVPIASHDVIDHQVNIKICLDVGTGAGKYLIFVDGVIKYSYDCQVGVEIQLTNSNFSSSLNSLVRNTTGQILQPGANPAGIAKGLIGNFQNTMTTFDVSSIGATGNNNERLSSQEAYFIIERMETALPNDYNKNYGRPSMITSKLGDLKGFTTVPNVLIETTATEPEKQEIIKLLNEGVIII